jgi:hypothetical protein
MVTMLDVSLKYISTELCQCYSTCQGHSVWYNSISFSMLRCFETWENFSSIHTLSFRVSLTCMWSDRWKKKKKTEGLFVQYKTRTLRLCRHIFKKGRIFLIRWELIYFFFSFSLENVKCIKPTEFVRKKYVYLYGSLHW